MAKEEILKWLKNYFTAKGFDYEESIPGFAEYAELCKTAKGVPHDVTAYCCDITEEWSRQLMW